MRGGDYFPFLVFLLLLAAALHWGEKAVRKWRQRRKIPFRDGVDYRNN